MGISASCAKFLFFAKQKGASFNQSLMLGRQSLFAGKEAIDTIIHHFKNNEKSSSDVSFKEGYAEPLFEILGAETIDSIDFSDYEKATVLHDLNNPVPDTLKNKYTAIFDGGTMEHIFNVPVAFKNCMQMLKVGGHYLAITPANNMFGHGFYQFSPELFFSLFHEQNGFKIKIVMLLVDGAKHWYEVLNPTDVKSRVFLKNDRPTNLMVIAEKIAEVNIDTLKVQQSDYEYTWAVSESTKEGKRFEKDSPMLYWYKKMLPDGMKKFIRSVYDFIFKRKKVVDGVGEINPDFFRKMEM
jgi:SAM-dependent methyltransferase